MPVNSDKVAAIARQKRLLGVQFIPASVGHAVTYPLDAESQGDLNALFTAAGAGLLPAAGVKITAIDNGERARVLVTPDEVKALGAKALGYFIAVDAHADALVAGTAQWDPNGWPSNA